MCEFHVEALPISNWDIFERQTGFHSRIKSEGVLCLKMPGGGTLTTALLRQGYGLRGRGQGRLQRFAGRGARNKSIAARFPRLCIQTSVDLLWSGRATLFRPRARYIVLAYAPLL